MVEKGWFVVFVGFFLFVICSAICGRRVTQLCNIAHLHTPKDAQRDSGRIWGTQIIPLDYPQTHHRSHQTTEDQSSQVQRSKGRQSGRQEPRIIQSKNHLQWKRSVKSLSPIVNPALTSPRLNCVLRYHNYTSFKYLHRW